jgi:hypothetical protein
MRIAVDRQIGEIMLHQMIGVRLTAGAWSVAALLPLLVACGSGDSTGSEEQEPSPIGGSAQPLNGSGAPSGPHFNLNIIGTSSKSASISTGGRIFVPLQGSTKILLAEGADFAVLDANGTDGSAQFQLPAADPDGDGVTNYEVFARALGKPGGASTLTTCATDPATGEELCSADSLSLARTSGRQRFQNVSKELLFVSVDLDGDGVNEQVSLFDDALQDFFWQVDNNGLRLAQLRFYPTR